MLIIINYYHYLEAVARMCSVKKVLLEISQNLRQNTGVITFFLLKKNSGTGVFLRLNF